MVIYLNLLGVTLTWSVGALDGLAVGCVLGEVVGCRLGDTDG